MRNCQGGLYRESRTSPREERGREGGRGRGKEGGKGRGREGGRQATSRKAGGVELFTEDMELQDLVFYPARFWSWCGPVCSSYAPLGPFGMVICAIYWKYVICLLTLQKVAF